MLILYITVIGITAGILANTMKIRFPTWLFLLTGFLGAVIGAGLSFGDSPLYLDYSILNVWTVPAIFAALFALTTLFADRRKIVANIVTDLVIIGAIVFILFAGGSESNYSGLFGEELQRAGIERVGQPIEGFSAPIYLEAFPGFEKADFDGVKSLEGVYNLEGTNLVYTRTAGNPVTSAEDVISESGYKTLLSNISNRLNVKIESETDIATILEKLREAEINQNSYITDDFSIWYPDGWYPYKNGTGAFFVRDENLQIPPNTDGFALGPYFQVTMHSVSVEEFFAQNLWTEGSEFLISKEDVLVNGLEGTRVVTVAAGAEGEVLHYVFNPDGERIFALSHYPYIQNSKETDDFERTVTTFQPNFVLEGE